MIKGMKWTHLPLTGGLYDQHPKFLDDMFILMNIEARWRAKEEKKNKPKPASNRGTRRR